MGSEERKHRRRDRREVIRRAYDRVHAEGNGNNQKAFRIALRSEAGLSGMDPATILILIRVGMALYKFWKSRHLSRAPVQPIQGEPDVDEGVQS